jgi:regulator of sirC expression with transglutaminase-like and TPR domain
MNDAEIKALISLLDDDDTEVTEHVEGKIRQLGATAIPFLETEWEGSFNPFVQKRIEELIHDLQYTTVLDRLVSWKNGGAMDLLEGLWVVATYQYPDLSLDKLRRDLEQLYYDAWLKVSTDAHPMDQVKSMNGVFYTEMKFAPNTKNFHSPANSMINQVLETRKGNTISLCLIYMMIAQKLGLPIYGVNLPNLFVLTYKAPNGVQFYINVFSRGLVFSNKDIDHYIAQLNLKPAPIFYQPCNNIDIVRRMLRNLMLSFDRNGDKIREQEVERLLDALTDPADSLPLSDFTQR